MSKRGDVVFKFLENMDDAGHSPPLSPENGRQAGVVPDKPCDTAADLEALGKGRMTEHGASFPTPNPFGERTGFGGLGVKSIQVIQLAASGRGPRKWPWKHTPGTASRFPPKKCSNG